MRVNLVLTLHNLAEVKVNLVLSLHNLLEVKVRLVVTLHNLPEVKVNLVVILHVLLEVMDEPLLTLGSIWWKQVEMTRMIRVVPTIWMV